MTEFTFRKELAALGPRGETIGQPSILSLSHIYHDSDHVVTGEGEYLS